MAEYEIRIDRGRLLITDNSRVSHSVTFEADVLKALMMQRGVVVLLHPDGGDPSKCFHNLLFIDFEGNLLWRAELTSTAGGNRYVDAEVANGSIHGWTWDGWYCTIDEANGRIKSCEFVK